MDASFESDPNGIAFDPTGVMELGGDYTQLGFATLKIDLEGSQPGEHDQLQVNGDVDLAGTLDVSTLNGFEPSAGLSLDIITANSVSRTFSNVVAPPGLDIDVVYTNSAVSMEVGSDILLGDVNLDEVVDFSDIPAFIAVLQSGLYQAEADVDQNGAVNFADIGPFINVLIDQ